MVTSISKVSGVAAPVASRYCSSSKPLAKIFYQEILSYLDINTHHYVNSLPTPHQTRGLDGVFPQTHFERITQMADVDQRRRAAFSVSPAGRNAMTIGTGFGLNEPTQMDHDLFRYWVKFAVC